MCVSFIAFDPESTACFKKETPSKPAVSHIFLYVTQFNETTEVCDVLKRKTQKICHFCRSKPTGCYFFRRTQKKIQHSSFPHDGSQWPCLSSFK